MDADYLIPNLHAALAEQLFPTVTLWNRLEGRPRRDDFDRALKAEVRDALWLLTKQWQVGEFEADDAGSPVFAKIRVRASPLTRFQAEGAPSEALPGRLPLEPRVEQRRLQWVRDGRKLQLALRAQLGRHWARLLEDAGLLGTYRSQYRTRYPFALPPRDESSDDVFAHREAWQQYAALAGRLIDGGELHLHLSADPGHRASDGITLATPTHGTTLDALGDELERWFAAEYLEPAAGDAWKPEYLEYQFSCSAPAGEGEQVLAADEYAQGRLDWYSFDRTPGSLGAAGDPGEHVTVSSFLPAPVSFEGMPDSRWWALEDRKTDFGGVKPSTTDLAQLLLMEFALVYADNWFLAPFRLPVGALARLDGMAVTTTFGERFWILPAGTDGAGSGRWSMFELTAPVESEGAGAGGLLLPPVVVDGAGSAPLEDVELARDEVANMVWAVERTVPSVTGRGRSGKDEARETRQYHELLVSAIAEPPEYRADIAYLATSSVPEHFIPFVPVHVDGSVREIQLQRSRMLRIIEGDPLPPEKVPPRTTLMREGLDQPLKQPYFVHEEEVPRAGARVTVSFRRARGSGGEAYVWLGASKQTGRGERSSGLVFDALVDARSRPST